MASTGPPRQPGAAKRGGMRPPPIPRPGINRAQTATPTLHSRSAPTESSVFKRSPKRKAQEAGLDGSATEETNINVVVRCRGRNDREVKENSAVVVSSDGIKGKNVELSMGPNAVSNKTYQFDKVFSPAADQEMVFDEVVLPIMDDVLAGMNCTIFAYGQTGTGKTYTMSGNIADQLPIPDDAGIIPRVLHALFDELNKDDLAKLDTSVKCSFIELYNEELRDLLAYDQGSKLKIFDDTSKNGRTATRIQGMEETHIENASKGIQLLREGSHRRQTAATRCNDLSSRSHTVFTMTVYTKKIGLAGEELISSSKLNLVDLAGSENIQRSGAENQRAAEAGLINKSLLTLGRVINALVDRSSHIPYRESKLTRLLQDSLGGQTKTCIIATLSPAKSNLEETISTLDYAFRAKNIRNKPQTNALVSKKTLLREYTSEIEKLKSELIATRHRNGFYLTAEAYEELTTQSESRRILSEEQRDKIEAMGASLRAKSQEIYELTETQDKVQDLLKELQHEYQVQAAESIATIAGLRKETMKHMHLNKAYSKTEEKLTEAYEHMRATYQTTTDHITQLQNACEERARAEERYVEDWTDATNGIKDLSWAATAQLKVVHKQQSDSIRALDSRIQQFVKAEMEACTARTAAILEQRTATESCLTLARQDVDAETFESESLFNDLVKVKANLRIKVESALEGLSAATQTISSGIADKLEDLQKTNREQHDALAVQIKKSFDYTSNVCASQLKTVEKMQLEIDNHKEFAKALTAAEGEQAADLLREEHAAAAEKAALMSAITSLITKTTEDQQNRRAGLAQRANKRLKSSHTAYDKSHQFYKGGFDQLRYNAHLLADAISAGGCTVRDTIETHSFQAMSQVKSIIDATTQVHDATTLATSSQMAPLVAQLDSLDKLSGDLEHRHHQAKQHYSEAIMSVSDMGYKWLDNDKQQLATTENRAQALQEELSAQISEMQSSLGQLGHTGQAGELLNEMRRLVEDRSPLQYERTGRTPERETYPTFNTPTRTEVLKDVPKDDRSHRENGSPTRPVTTCSPKKRNSISRIPISPSKPFVYTDTGTRMTKPRAVADGNTISESPTRTLQALDVNTLSMSFSVPANLEEGDAKKAKADAHSQKIKIRPVQLTRDDSKIRKTKASRTIPAGRENQPPSSDSTTASRNERVLRNRSSE